MQIMPFMTVQSTYIYMDKVFKKASLIYATYLTTIPKQILCVDLLQTEYSADKLITLTVNKYK